MLCNSMELHQTDFLERPHEPRIGISYVESISPLKTRSVFLFCRGMRWGGMWEGGSGWGKHVNPWLTHVNVWQKPLQ